MRKLALHELVERRTFRPTRHASMLEDGDLGLIADDDPDFARFMKLYDLMLLYRSTDDESERAQAARAFASLANDDDHSGYVELLHGVDWEYDERTDECVLSLLDGRAHVRADIRARVGRRVAL
jgi:hypothetical protein